MTPRHLLLAGAFSAALAAPASAWADAGPKFTDMLFMPVGFNLGGSLNQGLPNGFVFGGEISLAYVNHAVAWYGGYVDVLHDFGARATRFSFGPEAGWGPVGLDAGFLIEDRGGQVRPGTAVRLLLTISLLSVYGRWGHVFGDDERNFGEIGVLLKFPIPLWENPRGEGAQRWHGPPPAPPPPPPRPVPLDQPVQMVPRDQPVQPAPPDAPPTPPPAPAPPLQVPQ